MRVMPYTESLPYALYRAEQVREFDRIAIQEYAIPGAELMERAGTRAFQLMRERWTQAVQIHVICGVGNNGGDGYVLARLAKQAGLQVRVCLLGDPDRIQGDALTMAQAWRKEGGVITPFDGLAKKTDLIVDAILGTGLEREITGVWADAIQAINRHSAQVLAIDIPSGLNSDTGRKMGCAIQADATLSFIALKQGMFTGQGPDCCGEIYFDALDLPARIYARQMLSARRIDWEKLSSAIQARQRVAHKGDFGHVLVIGGDRGLSGAARLAAEAAARCGAGLVSVATHPEHAAHLNSGRPELMCRGVLSGGDLSSQLSRASVIAVGPGLGQAEWGRDLLSAAIQAGLPMVVDADALNLLSNASVRQEWVLTPHPGEAARLLGVDSRSIQADRFEAIGQLQSRLGGVVVLKGAGTLIEDASSHPTSICSGGNPGMATGGSGDLLTGIIASMIAQGFGLREAAELGVALHAAAGDQAALQGEIGMLSGDLLACFRGLLNRSRSDVDD